MADVVERLRDAVMSGEDGCGTLPARESVKIRPADWHRITRLAREAATEIETLRARLSQAGAGGGVVVKPLEWFKPYGNDALSKAETILGHIRVWTLYEANGEWFWSLEGHRAASANSQAEAKAAAQADYEARIRAALSTPPAPSAGVEVVREPFSVYGMKVVSDDGKRWRIVSENGDWEMQPVGMVTARQAEEICKGFIGLARERDDLLRAWSDERTARLSSLTPAPTRGDGEPATFADDYIDQLNVLCEDFGCEPGSDRLHWLHQRLTEANEADRQLSNISEAIGSVRFMDPPDGGDVPLAEQVARLQRALHAAESLARNVPDDATPEMIDAALQVDWSNEDEVGVVHNVWHAMRATMPKPTPSASVSAPSPATPVAVRYGFDGHGYQYLDNGSGSDWQTRQPDGELLFTDAPSPAGGVREAIARIIDPHSFVPYEPTGAADDAVFEDMVKSSLDDAYRKADRILALSSPATPEAVSAPAGEVRAASDNGKRWRIIPIDGDWEMQPVGHITAQQAEAICKRIERALSNPAPGHGEGVPVARSTDNPEEKN